MLRGEFCLNNGDNLGGNGCIIADEPRKCRDTMEKMTEIGWQQLRQMLETANQIFEVVRLVDPVQMQVVDIDAEGNFIARNSNCYNIWKRTSKCSNCSSLRAFDKECTVSKNENLDNNVYHTLSNVMCVSDNKNKVHKLVLEMISQTVPEEENKVDTVLIVDDQQVNRMILRRILENDYHVIEAENGKQVFKTLTKLEGKVSAIILDLIMPQMNGYEIIDTLVHDDRYRNIPILVTTGEADQHTEQKCLQAGAWDFVVKPINKETLRLRLKNIIARGQYNSQNYEKHLLEHDRLTGLYNRIKFFEETKKLIDRHEDKEFVLLRVDLDRFRLYNSFFGESEGDRLLIHFADKIKEIVSQFEYAVYGRIESDIFCICTYYDKKSIQYIQQEIIIDLAEYNDTYYIEPSIGVYVLENHKMSVEAMYNRATMAAETCKHKFMSYVGYYNEKMTDRLVVEQEVMNDAQKALDEKQFTVYLQPKTNIHTEEVYGAEALVRWIHPQKGLISPGKFIPVFESNGFIGRLDYYMWEYTCKLLRKWMDEGLEPSPVSVNVSRANMYNMNLVDSLIELTKKYDIPPKMLQLELTESAFMDDQDMMIKKVKRLQENGFTVLMDDFGSGYSSLNTLKDIPVDILKVDMKFLGTGDVNGRSERILASVVHMAEWLDLPVIVEGVETKEQRNFLDSIGCHYAQGYYYAKPMPWEEYENILRNGKRCQNA